MPQIPARVLQRAIRGDRRRRSTLAIALIAPLLLFLAGNFLVPVGMMFYRAIDDRPASRLLARTIAAMRDAEPGGVPAEAAFAALHADLREARANRQISTIGIRLNSVQPGLQTMVARTARVIGAEAPADARAALVGIDRRWGESGIWAAIRQVSAPVTPQYLLAALDLSIDRDGRLVRVPDDYAVFQDLWLRTLWMALAVTGLCALIGYPLAYWMAQLSPRLAAVAVVLVLVPFWTSVLVRTTAWIALLQREGVVNDILVASSLVDERLQLIRNRVGVYITMVHVLLPYTVLPLYAVMRRIPPSQMRAAMVMGANPAAAFRRVYFPQTRHGVGAGMAMVFILAVGFYITPALVGGRNDQMISYFIAYFTTESLNWNAAAALGVLLLAATTLFYVAFSRVFGLGRLMMR
jgi:putative spermidine/putrescine transport system permease protein